MTNHHALTIPAKSHQPNPRKGGSKVLDKLRILALAYVPHKDLTINVYTGHALTV
jgi:hypothetical protein